MDPQLVPFTPTMEAAQLIYDRMSLMPYGLDDLIRDNGPAAVYAWIIQPTSQFMWIKDGEDLGGVIGAYSIVPGRQADVAITVWDRRFLGKIDRVCLLGFAFLTSQYDLHRIQAMIPESNHLARALARRLGMQREGFLRGVFKFRGTFTDGMGYAILRDEVIRRLEVS